MKSICLSGDYQLYIFDSGQAPERPGDVTGDCIPASVPGNVVSDLYKAGLIPDPLFADNARAAAGFENKDFWLIRDFTLPEKPEGKLRLRFDGVDTVAEYYLNGVKLGESENMFVEQVFDVTDAVRAGKNTLAVHIRSAVEYAKQFTIKPYNVAFPGCYENLHVRKSAISYGWDISPRLLSAGIWRDVWLETANRAEIKDVYLATATVRDGVAVLVLTCNADIPDEYLGKCELQIEGVCNDSRFSYKYPMPYNSATVYPYVYDPLLWWPNGMGDQNLYDIAVRIVCEDETLAERKMRFGIRKAELIYGDAIGEEGRFELRINGILCRCRGANRVPVSLLHGGEDIAYEEAVKDLKDSNCNIVRVWGGGVYDGDRFFELCDEYGIMVWQDIMLACHAYPMDDRFYKLMEEECAAVAKRIRNHACLVLWCGGNETDWPYVCVGLDPNDDRISRGAIKNALWQNDPYRAYLPSTPYFSRQYISKRGGDFYLDLDEIKEARKPLPQEHYWWHREDFLNFREQNHKFITEIGYSGASDRCSIDRYLPDGWTFDGDEAWKDHSYPTEGTRQRGMEYLFTDVPENDDDKILASQYYQAEAYKFIVELSRMRKYSNGIILWTMRENWPSFSSATVDYYGKRKKAFFAVKASYEPVQCMIDIRDGVAYCYFVNDRLDGEEYEVSIKDEKGNVLFSGKVKTDADTPSVLFTELPTADVKVFLTETSAGERRVRNYRYVYRDKISYPEYRGLYGKIEEQIRYRS